MYGREERSFLRRIERRPDFAITIAWNLAGMAPSEKNVHYLRHVTDLEHPIAAEAWAVLSSDCRKISEASARGFDAEKHLQAIAHLRAAIERRGDDSWGISHRMMYLGLISVHVAAIRDGMAPAETLGDLQLQGLQQIGCLFDLGYGTTTLHDLGEILLLPLADDRAKEVGRDSILPALMNLEPIVLWHAEKRASLVSTLSARIST